MREPVSIYMIKEDLRKIHFNNKPFPEEAEAQYSEGKSVYTLDTASFIKLLQIAYKLKKALQAKEDISREEIEHHIPLMAMLFEYIVRKMDKQNLDNELLQFLEKFLGRTLQKEKEKEKENDYQEEEEISKQEKDRRFRLAMYEIYKLMNPRQLAGETALDNFINNVRTRGVGEALKYEGSEYATEFKLNELQNFESHRFAFNRELRDNGAKGISIF